MFDHHPHGSISLEWLLTAQHMVDDHTQTVNIAPRIYFTPLGLLGTHVGWRADYASASIDNSKADSDNLATPKSEMNGFMKSKRILSGLRSRWITPFLWA